MEFSVVFEANISALFAIFFETKMSKFVGKYLKLGEKLKK